MGPRIREDNGRGGVGPRMREDTGGGGYSWGTLEGITPILTFPHDGGRDLLAQWAGEDCYGSEIPPLRCVQNNMCGALRCARNYIWVRGTRRAPTRDAPTGEVER